MSLAAAILRYEIAKLAYRRAGRKASGKPAGADERVVYEAAKHEYHLAGRELRRARREQR